jgi:hypothetical protein
MAAQNVEYLSAGSGAALDLGFPVLVPSWVPGPFGGEPAIDAGGGSYSLYWMIGGGEPTFLQVSGAVGGGLPAGSPYDLNIQLSINASVNGFDAIHDVTPIYDAVWWIQGGVLYSVQSRNMTGTDSLGLAQALIAFVPPAAPEPTSPPPTLPSTEAPVEEPLPTAVPVVDETGEGDTTSEPTTDEADASSTESEAEAESVTPSDPGQVTPQEEGSSEASQPSTQTGGDAGTTEVEGDDNPGATAPGMPAVGSDGTGDPTVGSDGTGGPPVEVLGTDGTGGDEIIVIPRPLPVLEPIE